jgi:hypothetical protein
MSKTALLLLFLSGFTSSIFAAEARLTLAGSPIIVVDPFCNQDGTASGKAKVRNEGAAGSAPISLFLTASDVTSKPAGKPFNGKLTVTAINGPADDQPSGKKTLGPGEEAWIKIDASRVGEGEWEAVLQNESVDVGKIRIVRNELPFPVSMDVPAPDAPELTIVQGQTATFRLKNDGSNDYQITWEYNIDGHTLRSTDEGTDISWWDRFVCWAENNCASQYVAPSPVGLSRNGLTPINFRLPATWFGSSFTGLFKDNVQDGRLVISRVDCACTSVVATKIFKVKTHLATNIGNSRELWADFWVFWILLLGGVCSLTLNFALPNQLKRQKLKEKLGGLGRQVSGLSIKLASRLRVMAGLEQRLLGDRLRNLTWNNPDFTTEMQNIETAATQVEKRIQLLGRMGTTRTNFENQYSLDLPPTVIVGLETLFDQVGTIVRKAVLIETDIEAAQTLLQNIQDQIDSRGKSNAAWVSGLPDRITDLQKRFDAANGDIGKSATWTSIKPNLQSAADRVTAANATKIAEKDYLALDRALFKLELVVDYIGLVGSLPANDPLAKTIKTHEADWLKALKLDGWEQLGIARNLLQQMRQGHFADDISSAITSKKVAVKCDRLLIRQYEPCEFWIEWPPELSNASARLEWTCKWEFSNKNEQTLFEEGWQITHYFQRSEPYELKVTLIKNSDRTTVQVDPTAVPAISVQEEKRRRWSRILRALIHLDLTEARAEWKKSRTGAIRVLELLWLVLALFLALIGMIAGAKEQILKLDVVPAMIAIFLVGFGADQVKTLLTKRQS